MLGDPVDEAPADRIRRSLERSLETLRLDRVDLCFLHTYVVDDGRVLPQLGEFQPVVRRAGPRTPMRGGRRWPRSSTRGSSVRGGSPAPVRPTPCCVRCGTSRARRRSKPSRTCLDSPAEIRRYEEPARPGEIIVTVAELGIGVLGIRAVGAGAITDALDRDLAPDDPVAQDFARAAPVRDLAGSSG